MGPDSERSSSPGPIPSFPFTVPHLCRRLELPWPGKDCGDRDPFLAVEGLAEGLDRQLRKG